MPDQTVSLPSMTALKAFEAAARHLSFTGAAKELEQTQGAISHQIRELESRLGVALFIRQSRGISLTTDGEKYLYYVSESLDRLKAGAQSLQAKPSSNVLTVSCSANFAQKWLVPRLGHFIAENPEIDLRISATDQHVTFSNDGVDLAIRHGNGYWPQLSVTQLCSESIFPVCSPHLIPKLSEVQNVQDLKNYVLIHNEQLETWDDWLRAVGVEPTDFDLERGPVLSRTSLCIDAAIATRGIALARSALVELDLAEGRLVRPVSAQVEAPFSYWIVCPKESEANKPIKQFRSWIVKTQQ